MRSKYAVNNLKQVGNLLMSTAALMGGAAAFVREQTSEAVREHPPEGKFIKVDGVRLHYIERGTGPALVLLHGNVVMAQDFTLSPLFEIASERYRVIVFDRPGFGYSERPTDLAWGPVEQADLIKHALDKLGVERPIVLGHSWGAFVALELAVRYPEYLAGVVLASGYYYPTPRLDAIPQSVMTVPGLRDVLGHTLSPLISRAMWPWMLRLLFEPGAVPERYAEFPVWVAVKPSQLRAVAEEGTMAVPNAIAHRDRLHKLAQVPTMIIAGDSDKAIDTTKESVRLHNEVPETQLHVVHGAGHMVHHTAPAEVMDAIDNLAAMASARVLKQG